MKTSKRVTFRRLVWLLPLLAAVPLVNSGRTEDKPTAAKVEVKVTVKAATTAERIAAMARATRDAAIAEVKKKVTRSVEAVEQAVSGRRQNAASARAFAVAAAPPVPVVNPLPAYLNGILQREIYFIHKTCNLTPDQWKTVTRKAQIIVEEIAADSAQGRDRNNRGMFSVYININGNFQQVRMPEGSVQRLRDETVKAARQVFTLEQIVRLDKGVSDRKEFARRSAVLMCIVSIDRELVLSAEQRAQLTEKLMAAWQESWGIEPEQALYNQHQIPEIPIRLMEATLTKSQLVAWESLTKVSNRPRVQQMVMNEPLNQDEFDLSRVDPRFVKPAAPPKIEIRPKGASK